ALRPLKVFGEVAEANAAPSMDAVYGEVPPENVAVAEPLAPPLQLTSTSVRLRPNAVGWLTVIDWLAVQPLLSCTLTVCKPEARPVNVKGELCAEKLPPSILTWYGDVPPEKVAVTVPSFPPLQLTST